MRILVLNNTVPSQLDDKVPWHFFQELRPLAARGHHVCVASAVQPSFEIRGIEFRKVVRPPLLRNVSVAMRSCGMLCSQFTSLPPIRNPGDLRGTIRLCQWNDVVRSEIRRFAPDVIHSHWAMPAGSGGYLAAVSEGVPLVMTLRGCEHLKSQTLGYGNCLDPFYERTLARALQHASAITICCSDSRRRLEELGVSSDSPKVTHLFHAIDSRRFFKDADGGDACKLRLGLEGRRVITCVAMMDGARKGHATLLEALQLLRGDHPDVALLLVGDGPHRGVIEQRSRELGLADRVVFTGQVHASEVHHAIQLAEMTVLATHIEAFGNAVFESLILGVPVISSSVGAAADVFADHGFGLLFAPGDAAALADTIRRILASPDEFRERARRGAEFVAQRMSIDARIDGFIDVYRRVLQDRSARQVSPAAH